MSSDISVMGVHEGSAKATQRAQRLQNTNNGDARTVTDHGQHHDCDVTTDASI
ncbi:unnamed protein product [Ectocarpus sp. 12 AP-2014]